MTAWAGWQYELLSALGDQPTPENVATLEAFQTVEGHGGNYNPFNVGPGPFEGKNLTSAPWKGTPSPYPPTLDFPGPTQGIDASVIVGDVNWPGLWAALKGGKPLEDQSWVIDQGAATPPAQYTQDVRNIAQEYLSGQRAYSLGDTGMNTPGAGSSSSGGSLPSDPSGCHSSSWTQTGPKTCDWYPNGKQGPNDPSPQFYNGTVSADGASCCVASGAQPQGPTPNSPGTQVGCNLNTGLPVVGSVGVPQVFCDIANAIKAVLAKLTSATFWFRVGEVVAGLVLVFVGIKILGGDAVPSPPVPVPV